MKRLIFAIAFFLIVPLCLASLGTFKQGECVNIKTILNSTEVNISTISYPNSTIIVSNEPMTKNGYSFNYSFCDTNTLGVYIYDYFDDGGNVYVNNFEITRNGSPAASGSVIVLFAIIFIISAGLICFLAVTSIGHLLNLNFDIIDFAKDFGIYVIIIVLYYLEQFYVGNPVMDSWLLFLISWGWTIFIVVPAIALILSLTIGTLQKKQMNVRAPQQQRRRII